MQTRATSSEGRRRRLSWAACLAATLAPCAAYAGPPFLTDDPIPTDAGHWEIYAPAVDAAGKGGDYEGAVAVELNYGASPDLQITVGLPISYVHDDAGFHSGRGDLKVSAKYRFYHDESAGISVATFPGVTLPTASRGRGNPKATALIPVWAQKDAGPWSVFGGGGYAINPGPGARNYWTGGVAVTRQVSERLLAGLEVDRQGADTVDGQASTSLGLGGIFQLKAPFRLLFSGGPTFTDHEASPGFHAYVALGLDF